MDHRNFDAISRALAAQASRRFGLKTTLGALLGIGIAGDAAANRPARERGTPAAEGPCGSGRRKNNTCTKNSDCCTGICDTSKGKTNKDGQGRCRCRKKGKPCTSDKNCCGGRACIDGSCSQPAPPPAPVATGSACVPGVDVCADPLAACVAYSEGALAIMADGPIEGTYCLLPTGAACGDPLLGTVNCDSIYCAPGGNASGICGTTNLTDTCTQNTDSGAGSTIWTLAAAYGALLPCGVSMAGDPVMVNQPGAGSACTTDADCYGQANPFGFACVDNGSPSSLFSYLGAGSGGVCMTAFYPCTTANDCPVIQGYNASCDLNDGSYICSWPQ